MRLYKVHKDQSSHYVVAKNIDYVSAKYAAPARIEFLGNVEVVTELPPARLVAPELLICEILGVKLERLQRNCRRRETAAMRQAFVYVMRKKYAYTCEAIARILKRNACTIVDITASADKNKTGDNLTAHYIAQVMSALNAN